MYRFALLTVLVTLTPIQAKSEELLDSVRNFQRDGNQKDLDYNYASFVKKFQPGLFGSAIPISIETTEIDLEVMAKAKALACSKLVCEEGRNIALCACNFNTGKVASFKNECDLRKHNCRFDTDFKVILQEICPWEFSSRRLRTFNYSDSKYFNNV